MMTTDEKKKNVLDVFNEIAERYVEYFGEDWEFKNEIDDFIASVTPSGRVLDLGCGSGYISKYITDNGLRCEGIDICDKMIEIANKRYPDNNFSRRDVIDVGKYFEEDSFDGLIAIYILYLLPKEYLESTLAALSKILKKDAPFLMVTELGNGETLVDELLMPEGKTKKALYVYLQKEEEFIQLLKKYNFSVKEKHFYPNISPDEIPGDGRLLIKVINQK